VRCWTTSIGAVGLAVAVGCVPAPNEPSWTGTFGYSPSELHAVEIGEYGYPYVPVTVGDEGLMLPFDTGNMVDISLSSVLFDQLGLATIRTYDRVNSAGDVVATLRVSSPQPVSVLGMPLGQRQIHEFEHPSLPGLVGPEFAEESHFTVDYASRRIALSQSKLPDDIPGYHAVRLIRSTRHPLLILVDGSIEGRPVVMELDTGKSRSTVHPALAAELGLERGPRGVRVDDLRIGEASFSVPSAKEVDQTAIDPSLTEPILAGVGSDILSQFPWTVDYDARLLWLPVSGDSAVADATPAPGNPVAR
jgi:hypothetical protein